MSRWRPYGLSNQFYNKNVKILGNLLLTDLDHRELIAIKLHNDFYSGYQLLKLFYGGPLWPLSQKQTFFDGPRWFCIWWPCLVISLKYNVRLQHTLSGYANSTNSYLSTNLYASLWFNQLGKSGTSKILMGGTSYIKPYDTLVFLITDQAPNNHPGHQNSGFSWAMA